MDRDSEKFEIVEWDEAPIAGVDVVSVAPGGRLIEERCLPVLVARATGLPNGLDGIVATSDLQAYDSTEKPPFAPRLGGHAVIDVLQELEGRGAIPELSRMGALLPGDYYAVPTLDRRGGLGDVRGVWRAFAERFSFTVGVAGNHDAFGAKTERKGAIPDDWNARLLDGENDDFAGLQIGGVCGVIGKKKKPWRHSKKKMKKKVRKASRGAQILVLHEGPDVPGASVRGSSKVRKALLKVERPMTVFCGHRNWPEPHQRLGHHTIVNVDSRVVVIVR